MVTFNIVKNAVNTKCFCFSPTVYFHPQEVKFRLWMCRRFLGFCKYFQQPTVLTNSNRTPMSLLTETLISLKALMSILLNVYAPYLWTKHNVNKKLHCANIEKYVYIYISTSQYLVNVIFYSHCFVHGYGAFSPW